MKRKSVKESTFPSYMIKQEPIPNKVPGDAAYIADQGMTGTISEAQITEPTKEAISKILNYVSCFFVWDTDSQIDPKVATEYLNRPDYSRNKQQFLSLLNGWGFNGNETVGLQSANIDQFSDLELKDLATDLDEFIKQADVPMIINGGVKTEGTDKSYMGTVIKHSSKFFSPKTKKIWSDAPYMENSEGKETYDIEFRDDEGDTYSTGTIENYAEAKAELQKLRSLGYDIIQTWKWVDGDYKGPIREDIGGTTADMAVYDAPAGIKSKGKANIKGYTLLGEGIDQISPDKTAELKARPDYEKLMNEFEAISKEFGLNLGSNESISSQLSKKHPIYQKEFIAKADEFCAKYGLTLQGLGLEEGYDYAAAEREYADREDFNQAEKEKADKDNTQNKTTDKMKNPIKEDKIKKLIESYGIVSKASAPVIDEADDEESDKDEDGDKEEKDDKKSKGPKKGVNPFAKKGEKKEEPGDDDEDAEEDDDDFKGPKASAEDDEDESEDEQEKELVTGEEEEAPKFQSKNRVVTVKGFDIDTARDIAVSMLANVEGAMELPEGEYELIFKPVEKEEDEELDEYAEIQPSHIPGAIDDKTKQARA